VPDVRQGGKKGGKPNPSRNQEKQEVAKMQGTVARGHEEKALPK